MQTTNVGTANISSQLMQLLCLVCTFLVIGTDFSTTNPVATFPVGALAPGCIEVDILPDTSVEGDHAFSVCLHPGPIIPSLTVGTPDTTVVTITDDANDGKFMF